jgi:hypothetical protein
MVGATLLAFVATSCGATASGSIDPVAPTVTVSPSPTAPSDPPSEPVGSSTPAAVEDGNDAAVPAELVGTWQSVDQGSAEDLIEIHADGSYLRAMGMMQQRPSGVFSMSIGTTGQVVVEGLTLRIVPASGTESLSDPDAPSDSYTNRPLEELTPEVYEWSVSGGSLWLGGQFGVVQFVPAGP